MFDTGQGAPVVLIPGIQGRWEWMMPAVRALAEQHRVLTFSLDEIPEPGNSATAFDAWIAAIDRLLDRANEPRAVIVGVSFGGLVAARYAARRPQRAAAVVFVSTPSPRYKLDPQSELYARHPYLALPLFALRGLRRLLPEAFTARLTWRSRARFLVGHGLRALRAPVRPKHMAAWVGAWRRTDIDADCRQIAVPVLLLTGEVDLDRVVPVADTLEIAHAIRHARHVVLPRTGHIGIVSRPVEFTRLVSGFVRETFEWPEPVTRERPIGRAG